MPKIISYIKSILRLKDARLEYYKKIYRRGILFSKPVKCGSLDFEIHIVTCKNHLLNAIWCLKTFYYYSGLRPKLVIHDDGSLGEKDIKELLKHFVNCRIIKRKDADKELNQFLSNYKYTQKARSYKTFFCCLKFFDAFYYAEAEKILVLDSDILFFKKPSEMIEYIKEDKPFFNSDYQNAYARPARELSAIMGMDILPKVNAGLTFLRKEWCINNLDFMENYFEKAQNFRKGLNDNRHEQTLSAFLLSKYKAIRLNENYQISAKPITGQTISHHFCTDGSRKNFYKQGLRYLKQNRFLQKFNRCSYVEE
jgi:hypothetical protein